MGEDNFLKQAGGFIIAFLLGSVTLHGLLYYLVTDAGDLFNGSNGAPFPLFAFLLVYSALPLLILSVWRYRFVSKRLLDVYATEDANVKAFKRYEHWLMAMLWLGMVVFNCYMGLWLFHNNNIEPLYIISFVAGIFSIILIVLVLLSLSRIKSKDVDTDTTTKNDETSIETKKAFRTEFIVLCLGWLVLLLFVSKVFNEHADWKTFDLGENPAHLPEKEVKDTLIVEKTLLSNAQYLSDQVAVLEEKFLLANFSTDTASANNFERLITDYNQKSLLWHKSLSDSLYSGEPPSLKDSCYYKKSDALVEFNLLSAELDGLVNRNAIADFNFWLALSKNKTITLNTIHEDKIIDALTPVLIKSQFFILVHLTVLLLLALIYWYVTNMAYVDILRLDNTDSTPEPLKEIDISKALLVLIFVFLVPVLKPIQREDIQFHHPLWTANVASITQMKNPGIADNKSSVPSGPSISITYDSSTTISNPKVDSLTLASIKLEIESIKLLLRLPDSTDYTTQLNSINAKVTAINKKLNTEWPESKDYSKQLKEIEARVKAIEKELNKTKRR